MALSHAARSAPSNKHVDTMMNVHDITMHAGMHPLQKKFFDDHPNSTPLPPATWPATCYLVVQIMRDTEAFKAAVKDILERQLDRCKQVCHESECARESSMSRRIHFDRVLIDSRWRLGLHQHLHDRAKKIPPIREKDRRSRMSFCL